MERLEQLVKNYFLPATFMVVAGLADSFQTYLGIQKHGLEHLADLEGNPVLRSLVSYAGTECGLFLPKAIVSSLVLGTSVLLAQREKVKEGKYLFIGAGTWWTAGFCSNYFLYYS